MKKHIITLVLFAVLISLASPPASAATGFTDVGPNEYAWAQEAVAYMADNGYMKGDGKGNFQPAKPITKAELGVLLYRMFPELRSKFPPNRAIIPSDLPAKHWAREELLSVFVYTDHRKYNIGNYGSGDKYTLQPDAKVNRWKTMIILNEMFPLNEDEVLPMAVLNPVLKRIKDIKRVAIKEGGGYSQNNCARMANQPIICLFSSRTELDGGSDDDADLALALYNMVSHGILTPDKNGKFRPKATITRAEIATILYRIKQLVDSKTINVNQSPCWAPLAIPYPEGYAINGKTEEEAVNAGYCPSSSGTSTEAVSPASNEEMSASDDEIPAPHTVPGSETNDQEVVINTTGHKLLKISVTSSQTVDLNLWLDGNFQYVSAKQLPYELDVSKSSSVKVRAVTRTLQGYQNKPFDTKLIVEWAD